MAKKKFRMNGFFRLDVHRAFRQKTVMNRTRLPCKSMRAIIFTLSYVFFNTREDLTKNGLNQFWMSHVIVWFLDDLLQVWFSQLFLFVFYWHKSNSPFNFQIQNKWSKQRPKLFIIKSKFRCVSQNIPEHLPSLVFMRASFGSSYM